MQIDVEKSHAEFAMELFIRNAFHIDSIKNMSLFDARHIQLCFVVVSSFVGGFTMDIFFNTGFVRINHSTKKIIEKTIRYVTDWLPISEIC